MAAAAGEEAVTGDEEVPPPPVPCLNEEAAPGVDGVNAVAAGNNGKYRLSKSFIRGIISLRREPLPTTEYMESLAPLFPPEWLEEQKRLHEEEVEICRKVEDDFEEFRLRVIHEVKEKGYFEVDEKFVAKLKAADEHMTQHWATKDFSGLRFATPEEEALNADGYHQYLPDEDDALLSDGDDDGDELEEYALQGQKIDCS